MTLDDLLESVMLTCGDVGGQGRAAAIEAQKTLG